MNFATGRWLALLLATATLLGGSAQAAAVTEGQARALLAEQQRAWNAGQLDAYFATFRSDAVFTDQYRTPAGELVPYGSSKLPQARAQARKFRAQAKASEAGEVVRLVVAGDGRSAEVVSRVVSRNRGPQGLRVTCAERRQSLVLTAGRLRSKGALDTFSRCPR
jgi:hypothetical protein